jgi:hypothetical protein
VVPKRKLSKLRALEPSLKIALGQFEIAYLRFQNAPTKEKPITTEDFTSYSAAISTFLRAFTAFHNGLPTATEKLREPLL